MAFLWRADKASCPAFCPIFESGGCGPLPSLYIAFRCVPFVWRKGFGRPLRAWSERWDGAEESVAQVGDVSFFLNEHRLKDLNNRYILLIQIKYNGFCFYIVRLFGAIFVPLQPEIAWKECTHEKGGRAFRKMLKINKINKI